MGGEARALQRRADAATQYEASIRQGRTAPAMAPDWCG